tara:strand:- start:1201 stop:1617 length:417 start_codon:yes stop_codon:yes gene_type:complete
MITFIVTKDDVTKTIQFSTDGTLLDLKKEIIKQFDIKCDYIDIISNVEVPIRVMGKFNYDKGLQPRTLDNYPFNRYGIDERIIPITFNEATDYLPVIKKPSTNTGSSSKYVPPNGQSLEVKKNLPTYDLNNPDDFPSL